MNRHRSLAFVFMATLACASIAADSDAHAIYSKKFDVVGYARLLKESDMEGCQYSRFKGKIEHLNRGDTGTKIIGFALKVEGSKHISYINVSFDRLSVHDMTSMTNAFETAPYAQGVAYQCGAAGRVQFLDEIEFIASTKRTVPPVTPQKKF